MKILLLFIAHHYDAFVLPELESVLAVANEPPPPPTEEFRRTFPFLVLDVKESTVELIIKRCILVKAVYRFIASAPSLDAYEANTTFPKGVHVHPTQTGKRLTEDEMSRVHDVFRRKDSSLVCDDDPPPGSVVGVLFDSGLLRYDRGPFEPSAACMYVGVEISNKRTNPMCRHALLKTYSLKKRCFLGPTSMDAELAFLMANQGKINSKSIVFDPFVGTGSVLIACAAFGSTLNFGTDIQYAIVGGSRAMSGNRLTIAFDQYELPHPELFRMDSSPEGDSFVRKPFFDAIVCDPPYGIREGARKKKIRPKRNFVPGEAFPNTMTKEEKERRMVFVENQDQFACTQAYDAVDVYLDLLNRAAISLKIGGRLVFWMSISKALWKSVSESLPRHPALEFVSESFQPLHNVDTARRLVTMQKIKEPLDTEKAWVVDSSAFDDDRERSEIVAGLRAAQREKKRQKRIRTQEVYERMKREGKL